MELVYKKANIEDIPTLIQIENNFQGSHTYSPMLESSEWTQAIQDGPVYIIFCGNTIIGNVMYELKSPEHAYISGLVIMPEFQGQGFARKAMKYILEEIGNVKRIDLVTHPDNLKAVKLYQSFGFSIESRKENYFGDGEPRVVMSLLRN